MPTDFRAPETNARRAAREQETRDRRALNVRREAMSLLDERLAQARALADALTRDDIKSLERILDS